MARLGHAQVIECFHLAFLLVLSSRYNQKHYVVKGGANLRYFFDSHRYSEDIDFDAIGDDAWRLEEKVDEALGTPAVTSLLRSAGVAVAGVAKPKQTETTQRWKVLLTVPGRAEEISTKIEFSRRNGERRAVLEAVPDRVVAPYALRAPTLLHYTAATAIEQKVLALAQRMETQARDVFDLELLFLRHRDAVEAGTFARAILKNAIENCLELPFEAFETQVLPFLDPDVADLYRGGSSWERTQSYVIERLMGLE